ncbi:PREDICTED: multidrug resistance-associated protein 4-like [Dinoponera quadriceps]|uniref:Multidrug resistance-associated protein 4-like n=1 Tax=Dinoponera quadriceps TaxID=609295 RepID=A0A6P3WNR0_DINQU|nr:PREDICTED: multidrug resistance-associated protein 4-like [Dinoponera quadriceps]
MNKDSNNMKRNPKETANIFSQIFLWWMKELFMKGAKRDLEESDIYRPLNADRSEKATNHLEKYWNCELEKLKKLEYTVGKDGQKVPLKKNGRPRLYKAIFRAFWLPYFITGIYSIIQLVVLRVLQPILQGWIIKYFNGKPDASDRVTREDALIYTAYLVISLIITVILLHNVSLMMQQIGMRVRIACSSLVYRKLLRLSRTSLSQTGTGQIVNLLSNDVLRFDQLSIYLNYIWIMPIQLVTVTYIMWQKIGISTFVGVGMLLIITLPIQGTFSLLSRNIRASIAVLTDRRVQLMSELIAGIQVVKMYAWEKPFSKIVSITRALEIDKIKFSSYVRAAYVGIIVFTERLILYITLITFVLSGNRLTADVTYVLASYFNILQLTTALFFPQALIQIGETMVSINRLEEFLLMDEVNMERPEIKSQSKSALNKSSKTKSSKTATKNIRHDDSNGTSHPVPQVLSDRPVRVELQRVSANWINGQLPPTLCNISTTIKPGELCALVGAVGSGKSSLLHLLLKELNPGAGNVIFTQDFSQESEKMNIRCKMNIGYTMDNPNLCISYASQEAWLFGGTVRDNILFGQPYDKTKYAQVTSVCALTKDFRQLPQGDMTIIGDRGVSLSGGQRARVNLARAVYRQADLYLLDDPLSAVDTHVSKHLYKKCITEYLAGKTRILVTHQLQFLKRADHIIVLDRGFVKMQGSYNELVESNKDFINMMDSLSHEAQKKEEVRKISVLSSKKISIMRRPSGLSIKSCAEYSDIDDMNYEESSQDGEAIAQGNLSSKVYKEYMHHGGNYFVLFLLMMCFVISQIATTGNDYWASYWTNLEEERYSESTSDAERVNHQFRNMRNDSFLSLIFTLNPDGLLSSNSAIYVYTFTILACTITTLSRSFLFMKICMNSSCNLHNTMFTNLVQARMSFFNANPAGRILNRFSKDVGTMDELLPKIMLEALQLTVVMGGILVMEIIINYWMLIAIAILGIIFLLVTKVCLRTAQNTKRLEAVTKSPLFSHVSSTLNGLPTIRSSGSGIELMMQKQFDSLQDYHSGAWYLVLAIAAIFGLVLDLVTCVFVACICFSFIAINGYGGVLSGDVGLAISQSLILTGSLQYGVRQIAETISLMTSVERILQYTDLPTEKSMISKNPPPPTWPASGRLIFKNVNMKYDENDPPVLKNLNVSIEPGWKVGVVGRTGAGKSSLISALFRLFDEGLEGEIKIDDRDTSTVGLTELRSKISIIPQEPVLFSESLRYNLDPFNQYEDTLLWKVLQQVELNDIALDQDVFYGGHNFSVGQRQLICLARAILRNNHLLVLDEATANIDSHTDSLIQETIRSNFKECTVITIAHRLNTIIDSDRIIVMENGYIVEFGCPYELLHDKPNGYFSKMVENTGSQMARSLLEQAEKACQKNDNHRNLDLSRRSSNESDVAVDEIIEQSAL